MQLPPSLLSSIGHPTPAQVDSAHRFMCSFWLLKAVARMVGYECVVLLLYLLAIFSAMLQHAHEITVSFPDHKRCVQWYVAVFAQ